MDEYTQSVYHRLQCCNLCFKSHEHILDSLCNSTFRSSLEISPFCLSTPPHPCLASFSGLQSDRNLQSIVLSSCWEGCWWVTKKTRKQSVSSKNRYSYLQKSLELPHHNPVLTPVLPISSSTTCPETLRYQCNGTESCSRTPVKEDTNPISLRR